MNEIEKMYKNAGINCKPNYVYNKVPILSGLKYPPFTAEKQLKLVDWFLRNEANLEIIFDCEDELYFIETDDGTVTTFETFAETLASLVNIYFEDFTDREIEEIKEILE